MLGNLFGQDHQRDIQRQTLMDRYGLTDEQLRKVEEVARQADEAGMGVHITVESLLSLCNPEGRK